jgi:hypothetical protein
MYTTRGTLWRVMLLSLIPLCLLQAPLWGEEASKDVPSPQAFVLTVHENLLSLHAREASLKAILAQIGREMAIDVVAHIPADEKITVEFDQLPVGEALKKLSRNYTYVVDAARADRRITKIVVLAKGDTTLPSSSTALDARPTDSSRSKPFKFEFDPSKVMQERK